MFILWLPIWVVFLQRKGLSLNQIGLLEAFAWILTAALEVPTGGIADRWGRRASMSKRDVGGAQAACDPFAF